MSISYIPPKQNGDWQGAFDSIAAQVRELKSSHVLDDEKIQELEDKFRTHGINAWDSNITYRKGDIVLAGQTSFQAGFYKSLKDDNTDHWPPLPESGSWWMTIAGDYVVGMNGDVTGFSTSASVQQVGGATAADIASVTNAIKSGSLDHPTALTIGETAPIVNIGTGANPKTINLGGAGDTVAVAGNLVTVHTDNLQVKDSLVRLNREGLAGSAADAGIEIEEAGAVTAYMKTNGTRNGFVFKAPATSEFALNQSVATNSSPSFQSLTTPKVTTNTGQLLLEQTGDSYGSTVFRLRNRSGNNGAQLDCSADSGVCDMDFLSGSKWVKMRFETRTSGGSSFDRVVSSDNVAGEFIVQQGPNHLFAIGGNRVTSVKPFTAKAGINVEGNVSTTDRVSGRTVHSRGWMNPAEPGAYVAWDGNITGKTHFVTQRGTFEGGWNWLAYDSTNAKEGTPMDLSRTGNLTVANRAKAKHLLANEWMTPNEQGAWMMWNRSNGHGRTAFVNQQGGGWGGWEWINYKNDNTEYPIAMTLSRDGDLPVTRNATINGNLTVTGTTSGSTQTETLSGTWQWAFNDVAATIKVTKTFNMVYLTMGLFTATPIDANIYANYSLTLPTWARPSGNGVTFSVPFPNGTKPKFVRLTVLSDGSVSLTPPDKFDTTNTAGFDGSHPVVSYVLDG